MERIMAVYDMDPVYAQRFADVANQKERIPLTVVPFTTLEALKEYAATHTVEILLASVSVPEEQIKDVRAKFIVRLAEGEAADTARYFPNVYKYQPVDSVLREVMSCYCEQPIENSLVLLRKRARVMGIYSPIGRCLKTSLALTLGQQLARDGKVLYIGLEEFSGFSRLLGEQCRNDFSDVLYYFRQGDFNVMRLKSLVYAWKEVDYLPPVRYPEDLEQMTGEEAGNLLEILASEMGYEYLIVDVGRLGRNMNPILEACDVIYMPIREDGVSAAKLEEFDDYLGAAGRQHLRERIKQVKLPDCKSLGRRDTYMEQLLWGEMGDYVRRLLKGVPWR